jgi:heme/copper-type cytochrome/quinol oxidase subunit 3
MSQAVAVPAPAAEKQVLGVTNGKMAMWIFLGSDGMSFMGLIASYVALRIGNLDVWPNPTRVLNIPLTALNTFILICSSVSMVKAYEGALDGNVRKLKTFLLVTILGGATFLGIQVYEYQHLLLHLHLFPSGFYVEGAQGLELLAHSENFGATFYALTCFHGCHVFSGVVYLSAILIGVLRNRWTTNRIEIVGLYWHFVDLLWIIIFTIVYLIE